MFDEKLRLELNFKTSRSSGSGGQHVNKTETRVELFFNIKESKVLSEKEKTILLKNLHNRLIKNAVLRIVVSETRSQSKNKEIAINNFLTILHKGLFVAKKRKPTKVPKKATIKRLEYKSKNAELKNRRKKIDRNEF